MGRTKLERALAGLKENIEQCEKNKKKILDYVQQIKDKCLNREIPYYEYEDILSQKLNGKTIRNWLNCYDSHIEDCRKRIKKLKRKSAAKKVLFLFFSLAFIAFIIFAGVYLRPIIVGLIVEGTEEQTPSAESATEGTAPSETTPSETTQPETTSQESPSEIQEEVPQRTSPSQEEPLPSETPSEPAEQPVEEPAAEIPPSETTETNITETTENITETQENITLPEEIPETPENITEPEENATQSPALIKNIPDIEIQKNSYAEIKISDYFSDAEQYYFLQTKNISTTTFDHTIKLQPEQDFTGTRTSKIIASNNFGTAESNFFDIIVSETNITIPANITLENVTLENITIPVNVTIENITEANATITTFQYNAIINQPVKWKKSIEISKPGIIKIKLPKEAENITVNKIIEQDKNQKSKKSLSESNISLSETQEGASQRTSPSQEELLLSETENETTDSEEVIKEIEASKNLSSLGEEAKFSITGGITGQAISEQETKKSIFSSAIQFFKSIFQRIAAGITGRAITTEEKAGDIEVTINDNATKYEIEYETPAPQAFEQEISAIKKQITISASDALNYTNILAYTELPTEAPAEKIHLYHLINEIINETDIISREEINLTKYDLNNNSLIDYVEWVVPHLSNQTYELIIEISKAEHLDENKTFISDIYEQVKALDGNWSEPIPAEHYVRVTFEQPLDNTRDITIYARPANKTECYDNETEVLTRNGDGKEEWKYFSDLGKDEKVMTLNAETGEEEWQVPLEKQEFDNNQEMYRIELGDGSKLLVSENHKVYSSSEIIEINSRVLNTFILSCLFNNFSSDHKIQLNFRANARYGESLVCSGNISQASGINSLNSSSGMNFILLSNMESSLVNSSEVLCVFDKTSSLLLENSINKSSGAISCSLLETNISSESPVPLISNENNSFASTTTIIYLPPLMPNLSARDLLTFFPNLNASSCVISDLDLNSLKNSKSAIFCMNASLATSDQFIILNDSILRLSSSGTDTVILDILNSSLYPNKTQITQNTHIYKSFALQQVSETYEEVKNGKELYFLDSENKPIKIKSITKEGYKGKIYDVDVENDIILVRRKNSSEIWSGNSNPENQTNIPASIEVYTQDNNALIAKFENISEENWYKVYLINLSENESHDIFDLKILGEVEFDYIVDPTFYYNFSSNVTNKAYWAWVTSSSLWTAGTQATTLQYTNLSLSDAKYALACSSGAQDYPFWRFNFTINQDISTIQSINITYAGKSNTNGEATEVRYWNYTSGAWASIGSIGTSATSVSVDLTSEFNQTINAGKQLVVSAEGTQFDNTECIAADFVDVKVVTSPPTFSSPAINETTIFPGMYINHTINIAYNASQYLFSWNGSGASCGTWVNSSWITTSGASTITANNVSLIPSVCTDKTIGWYFCANNSAGLNCSNVNYYNVSSYGKLTVNLTTPLDGASMTQNTTFDLNATITCSGGPFAKCGTVNAYARYNGTGATPDTDINTTSGATPFFVGGGDTDAVFWRPVNYSVSTDCAQTGSLTLGMDNRYNDTSTVYSVDCGVSESYYLNFTFNLSSVIEEASVTMVCDYDTSSWTNLYFWNYSSGSVSESFGCPINPAKITTSISKEKGTISEDGAIIISTQVVTTGFTRIINIQDLHAVTTGGGTYDYWETTSPSAIHNATYGNDCAATWCSGTEFASNSYNQINQSDNSVSTTPSASQSFNIKVDEDISNIEALTFRYEGTGTGTFKVWAWNSTHYIEIPSGITMQGSNILHYLIVNESVSNFVGTDGYVHIKANSTSNSISTDYINVNVISLSASNLKSSSAALSQGESFNVSWILNATGSVNSYWELGVLFNSSYGNANVPENNTNNATVKIIGAADNTYPSINITSPINNSNLSSATFSLNYTFIEANPGFCWYSNDSGAVNSSAVAMGTNWTLTGTEGANNRTVYCNDTSNNINSSYIAFTIDTIAPDIAIVYPANNTNTTDAGIDVNYTRSDAGTGVQSCWYSNDSYSVNTTLGTVGNCLNITTVTWAEGQHNVTVWVNDSAGNKNSSFVRFTIDTTAPDIAIVYPANNTNTTDNTIDVNYTRGSDVQSCWYSNDTMSANTTLASCINITTVTWAEGQHNVTVWANDSAGNINSSFVRFTIDTIAPDFTTIPANTSINYTQGFGVDFDATDSGVGFGTYAINWTTLFTINSSGYLKNSSSDVAVGNYYINVTINDTLNNINSTIYFVNISKATPVLTFLANGGTSNLSLIYPQQVNISATASGGTVGLDKDNVDYLVNNGLNVTLGAGSYIYRANITGNQNYSNVGYSYYNVTINKSSQTITPLLNGINNNLTITYPQQFNASYSGTNYTTITIIANNTALNKAQNYSWGSGSWIVNYSMPSNQNYSGFETYLNLTINKATGEINGTINGTQGNFSAVNGTANQNIYINATNITGVGTGKIYVNGTLYNSGAMPLYNITNLSIGFYNITFEYDGNTNYTSDSEVWWVNVTIITNQAPNNPSPNLISVDGTNSSATDLNCSSLITDPDSGNKLNVTVQWYNNSVLALTANYNSSYNNGTLFSAILNSGNTTAGENWSCGMRLHDGSAYSNWVNSSNLTILNTAPQITRVFNESMTSLSSGPNEAPAFTSVIINFSVYDANGASDLNDSSAKINFTKAEENTRENLTCSKYQSSGNYANYTCNVTMWWWDGAGAWTITAYIKDNQTNSATNSSTTFTIGSRTAFVMGPSALTWTGIAPGATNQTSSNDPLTLNNTGNDVIAINEIGINATNLLGEQNPSFGLWASNFSVAPFNSTATNPAECNSSATTMSASAFTNITGALLPKGNYTKGDATGQEQLYFCLRIIGSELINQEYSTANQGIWTVQILLVALTIRKTRKKNKKEKKLIENLTIPSAIFTQKLGALETITKYMKDNLGMSYHEIALILNRNDRTIWTAYKKAIKKQPESINLEKTIMMLPTIKIEKILIVLPVSIFKNKKLTILEAIIAYLREQGLRYNEIAKLLNRDQRNIWLIYSRTVKKI